MASELFPRRPFPGLRRRSSAPRRSISHISFLESVLSGRFRIVSARTFTISGIFMVSWIFVNKSLKLYDDEISPVHVYIRQEKEKIHKWAHRFNGLNIETYGKQFKEEES